MEGCWLPGQVFSLLNAFGRACSVSTFRIRTTSLGDDKGKAGASTRTVCRSVPNNRSRRT